MSREAGVVVYAFDPSNPTPWTLLKSFQGEAEIDNAGRLGSLGARLFVLVSTGYRGPARQATGNQLLLSAGDANILPDLQPAKRMLTMVTGDFRGSGILKSGCSDMTVAKDPAELQGAPLEFAWESKAAGETPRVLYAFREFLQLSPTYRERVINIRVEFSEDGYTALRVVSDYWRDDGPKDKVNLRHVMVNLPFRGFSDYTSPTPRRAYLHRITGRDKKAYLPIYDYEIESDGQKGSSDGIDWQSTKCMLELRLELYIPK